MKLSTIPQEVECLCISVFKNFEFIIKTLSVPPAYTVSVVNPM